jgi:Ca2+/Na+ antiporter
MERSFYEQRYGVPRLLGAVSLIVVGCAALVAARRWRTRSPAALYLLALLVLLLTCVLASILQHHLLGVLYLTGRTALYLLVLWTFVLVALFRELAPLHSTWRHGLRGAAVLLALHAARSANGRYVLEWKSGAEVRDVVRDLAASRGSRPPGKPSVDLGASLDYEAPLNYYRAAGGLAWLNVVDRHARTHPLNDFYLLSEEDWRSVVADSFTVRRIYPLSRARLLQRRARPARYLITRSVTLASVPARAGGSSWHLTLPADLSRSPAARSLVAVEGEVLLEGRSHTRAELAIRFRRGDSSYSWLGASLQDFARRPRTWYPLRLSCFAPADAREGDEVTVTLDHQDAPVQLRRLTVQWLTAQD